MTWRRSIDQYGDVSYTNGFIEIRRMNSTARSRYCYMLFRDGEPIKVQTKLGERFLTTDTLGQAKKRAEKLTV